MTTNQGPYGGGGFPPPWMHDSTQPNDDGVEWGDPLPQQGPGSGPQEPPGPSWDSEDSVEAGAGFPAPASGYQGHDGEREHLAREARPTEEDRPSGFDSILDTFSGAADATAKPARRQRPRKSAKVKEERARRATPRISISPRKVLVPVAILVSLAILVGLGFLGYKALGAREESTDAVEASQGPEVSREVPPGWSKAAAWTTPADVASNLAVRNDYIGYLNSSGVLVVVDGKSGDAVFSCGRARRKRRHHG